MACYGLLIMSQIILLYQFSLLTDFLYPRVRCGSRYKIKQLCFAKISHHIFWFQITKNINWLLTIYFRDAKKILLETRVGDNSGRVFFEFPRCMSLARYSIRYFVIRYKKIGILDIFKNVDFLKKYIYIYIYIYVIFSYVHRTVKCDCMYNLLNSD